MTGSSSSTTGNSATARKGLVGGTFRKTPYMGVIWTVVEAVKLGFYNGHPDWCNLGQGQPEIGPIEGAPERFSTLELETSDHAYGPVEGTEALRTRIAEHYNRLYRQGMPSQYTKSNVAVASGGRLALSRLFAALAPGGVAYQTPDYTAYQDYLEAHAHRLRPMHLPTDEEHGFLLSPGQMDSALRDPAVHALLVSNPCNPTGLTIKGAALAKAIATARETGTVLLLDEFYSAYNYEADGGPADHSISGAPYVEDVNRDPVLLIDGLTKGFRYPGWRLGWVVGPAEVMEQMSRVASALDGGPSAPVQKAALAVLEPARADQELTAVRAAFAKKRALMIERLTSFGVRFPRASDSTFYLWGDLSALPPSLRNADDLFRAALQEKVLTVPGRFFDVNPEGAAREGPSRFTNWARFSFGPDYATCERGLERLGTLIGNA